MDRCGFPTKPVSAAMVQRGAGNALYPLGRCQEAAAALKELPKPGPFTWAASTQNGWIRARTSHCAEVCICRTLRLTCVNATRSTAPMIVTV
jgi:hypothetical protein